MSEDNVRVSTHIGQLLFGCGSGVHGADYVAVARKGYAEEFVGFHVKSQYFNIWEISHGGDGGIGQIHPVEAVILGNTVSLPKSVDGKALEILGVCADCRNRTRIGGIEALELVVAAHIVQFVVNGIVCHTENVSRVKILLYGLEISDGLVDIVQRCTAKVNRALVIVIVGVPHISVGVCIGCKIVVDQFRSGVCGADILHRETDVSVRPVGVGRG